MKITRLPIHPAWRTTTVGSQLGCAFGSKARVLDADGPGLVSRPEFLAMPRGNA